VTETVRTELLDNGALLRIVFERDKGNVLTGALMKQIDAALVEHAYDKHLKLVLLEGAGKHFSFGASIEEHQRDQAEAMLETFHGLVRRIVRFPVPVAAVVRGKALGGAFEVALACRFVFAEQSSAFACPEIKLGVIPPVLAALGPQRLGFEWAQRTVLTGEELDAKTADRLGFVTQVAGDGENPFDLAMKWYEKNFKPLSAFAIRHGTDALRIGAGTMRLVGPRLAKIEKLYIERLIPSFDGNEGIAAFLEKRKPVWRDE